MKLAVASVIVLGLGLASPGMAPAFAQNSGLGPEYKQFSPPDVVEEKQQPFTIVDLSDDELRSYAQAMVVIMGIDDYYQQEFESAATEQEQETIAGEALGRMAQALDDEGISFKKYQEITAVAQQHPKIRSRIVAHMKDLTGIEE